MKNRYCVTIIHITPNVYYPGCDSNDETKFFDDFESADLYRKMCKRKGYKVTDVIDLEDLPF